MKALAAWIPSLVVIAACSDEPPPAWDFSPELPPGCSRDQRLQRLAEIAALEQRAKLLDSGVVSRRRAGDAADSAIADLTAAAASDELLAGLRDLLAKPCLDHAAALQPLPEYARWESVTFAIESGLFRALRDQTAVHRIRQTRALALLPELLPEPDLASRIDLRHLACPDDGVTACVDAAAALAPITAAFVREEAPQEDEVEVPLLEPAGLAHRRGDFDDRSGPLLRLCHDKWEELWTTGDLAAWRACIRQRAPRQLRYHAPPRIRALERGWLALRYYYGHDADDYHLWFFDLATGAAYLAVAHDLETKGEAELRSGQVPVAAVRQLALALLARPALVRVRAAPSFVDLPPLRPVAIDAQDLDPQREELWRAEEAASGRDVDEPGSGGSSATHLSFVLTDGADLRVEGEFPSWSVTAGTTRFANQQLKALTEAFDDLCTPADFPSHLALAPTPPPPPGPNSWACLPSRVPDSFRILTRALARLKPHRCD